jgi:polysaccharide deacetylase family protein (PEP-CTERM system associated)
MKIQNILTVDVEDWFHICGVKDQIPKSSWPYLESRVTQNTLKILEILSKKGIKATFFVLGFVAEQHPDLVKAIVKEGHEIGIHGYGHKRVYKTTPDEFRRDLKRAIDVVSAITHQPIKGYRAPEWSIRDDSLWALDILIQEGFLYDSSMAPLPIIGNPEYSKAPYKLVRENGDLWEFPPLVAATPLVNLPFGGGWGLRIFPYMLIRSAIRDLNSLGHPALISIHPRDFDKYTPKIPLPMIKRLVLEARIETTVKRLDRLLNDFYFNNISYFICRNMDI